MPKQIIILIFFLCGLILSGCQRAVPLQTDTNVNNKLLPTEGRPPIDSPKDDCISRCLSAKEQNYPLENGPCLGDPMEDNPDWVCDIAHSPRQAVDNDPANQCSAFPEGKASHFIEVDTNCQFIKAY